MTDGRTGALNYVSYCYDKCCQCSSNCGKFGNLTINIHISGSGKSTGKVSKSVKSGHYQQLIFGHWEHYMTEGTTNSLRVLTERLLEKVKYIGISPS